MKKILINIILCLCILMPIRVKAIYASSYIVLDANTKSVLLGSNIHEKHLIASISKIMTCIVTLENADVDTLVTVDESVLKSTGSSIYLEVGEKIKLRDLLYGMMLRSGNDAAIMIANAVAGDMQSFVKVMNDYAKKIGMKNTIFYNSHGLEENDGNGNLSTSYDMAILTAYAMKNTEFRKIFKTKLYNAKSDKKTYTWQNKNKLLKYDYVIGGKTGYTLKAKRTLVSVGSIDNCDVIIVTLKDSNDWNDHIALYKNIKENYTSFKVLSKTNFSIFEEGINIEDKFYIKNDILLLLKKGDKNYLKIKYLLNDEKDFRENTRVGSANIYVKDKLIYSEDIYLKVVKKKKKKIFQLFNK